MNLNTSTITTSPLPGLPYFTRPLLVLTLLLWTCLGVQAQTKTTATISTADGERFWVYVDGVKYNNKAKSRVEVNDLTPGVRYRLRISFENTNIPSIDQKVKTSGANGPVDLEYLISKKRNKYVIKLTGQTPAANTASNTNSRTNTGNNTGNTTTSTTTTTTTTTGNTQTTTTTTTNTNTNANANTEHRRRRTRTNSNSNTNANTGNSTSEHCADAMSDSDFEKSLASVKKQSFADDKLIVAKQIVKSKCVTAEQVKKLMKEFAFESNKLELAKFAYDYTIDQDNYFTVNDAFSFTPSVEELNLYLEGKK